MAFTIRRYGAIQAETLAALIEYLDSPAGKAERVYTIEYQTILDWDDGPDVFRFPVIRTNRIGSAVEKFIDNEHDAQNTLANIRNPNFPKGKQGQ